MKTTDLIWKGILIIISVVILIITICILKKVNKCCTCNETKNTKEVFVPRTVETYDSLTNKSGKKAFLDRFAINEKGDTVRTSIFLMTLWNNCPEKPIKKFHPAPKKTEVSVKVDVSVKEEPTIKRDTCPLVSANADTLKALEIPEFLNIELLDVLNGDTSILYRKDIGIKTIFNTPTILSQDWIRQQHGVREFVPETPEQWMARMRKQSEISNHDLVPDLHVKEYIYPAKTHLIIGTTSAGAGVVTFASTMFFNVPTFLEYNGLGYFDPLNKYYDHNIHERERLHELNTVRIVGIGLGVIGGIEIIRGIHMLKPAEISVSPRRITLKVSLFKSPEKK